MKQENKTWFLRGMRDGTPIMLGYAAVSFTLGIVARNAGLTVEKTLCDLIDDPKVVAKLRERIAAVPENLKKYESDPAHAFLAAEAAWLSEEYEANGVTSAEQLVVFCRKQ